jgi:hypothetical protein
MFHYVTSVFRRDFGTGKVPLEKRMIHAILAA